MTEQITVFRGSDTTDVDGNAIKGTPELWQRFQADIAPRSEQVSDVNEAGRTPSVSTVTVYIRASAPTGIVHTDLVEIRGTHYVIDGPVAQWRSRSGYKGDVFVARTVSG